MLQAQADYLAATPIGLMADQPEPWAGSSDVPPAPVKAILENDIRLDEAIDGALHQIVADTESSALAIIQQVRDLHDHASKLVEYLEGSNLTAGNLGKEILVSMNHLVQIADFMQRLPAKMQRDQQSVTSVVREIKELGGLVGDVQAISMQSHLLAINAAIEASHSGSVGVAFRVVADEMRRLAANTGQLATSINNGLARARAAVESGIAKTLSESAQQLAEVSIATESIRRLRENLEDMNQYYKTRFAIVTKHNEDMAGDIAEVLGQIQYQDVVRQCIERIQVAIAARQESFRDALELADRQGPAFAAVPDQLASILAGYLEEEQKHLHSNRSDPADGGAVKLELF